MINAAAMPGMKSVACRKCHARKVKCPGGQPCRACVQLKCEAECTYPKRDRQVKVNQSYIDRILSENRQLRAHAHHSQPDRPDTSKHLDSTDELRENSVENPVLSERPWFLPIQSSRVPIFIGEVADTVFATRFRQAISYTSPNHIPRVSYPNNGQLEELSRSLPPHPERTEAMFLLRSALSGIDGCHHIVRASKERDNLEKYLSSPSDLDLLSECKLLALFALGELNANRWQSRAEHVPGLNYFAHALKAHSQLLERPCIVSLELHLLLCLYSLSINRRHSAYLLASSAVHCGTVMGLNYNLPRGQGLDDTTREHMSRVWWTAYILDQNCATVSGQIFSIEEDDIFVDLPSTIHATEVAQEDFRHTDYLVARIAMAKLTRQAVKSLYSRRKHKDSFLQRVQAALNGLKEWLQSLPQHLRIRDGESVSFAARTLQLLFNQCAIITTRPVVLHVLRLQTEHERSGSLPADVTQNMQTLCNACLRCARQSSTLITELWIDGSFKTFDPYRTRYLFTCATVLAVSSVLHRPEGQGDSDRGNFELAAKLLEKLSAAGSYTAAEYCRLIEAMKGDMETYMQRQNPRDSSMAEQSRSHASKHTLRSSSISSPPWQGVQVGMVFSEPSLATFLTEDQPFSEAMDMFLDDGSLGNVSWPDLGGL